MLGNVTKRFIQLKTLPKILVCPMRRIAQCGRYYGGSDSQDISAAKRGYVMETKDIIHTGQPDSTNLFL